MIKVALTGAWQVQSPSELQGTVLLPGTLDTNGLGHDDQELSDDYGSGKPGPIGSRLTRRHTFEGTVRLSRQIRWSPQPGRRVFFEVERARRLEVRVGERLVEPYRPQTLNTPHVFELTGLLTGDDLLQVDSDNAYQGMPHDAIVDSSTATDHTQTNWNGLLGNIGLRVEEDTFVDSIRAYPHGDALTVEADVDSRQGFHGRLRLSSDALAQPLEVGADLEPGRRTLTWPDLPLDAHVDRWDEYQGCLHGMAIELLPPDGSRVLSRVSTDFGIRDFAADEQGRLALNGRAFFLRGEANCAEFPQTGFPPMDVGSWIRILEAYRSYGVNVVRFHSHCPPEAAFIAADRMGMMMQPELSHWDCHHAFQEDVSYRYYRTELEQTLLFLANHPSFVMLTLGNELSADATGHQRMAQLIEDARSIDDTRLYANSSNPHYGQLGSDDCNEVYTSESYKGHDLRCCFADMRGSTNAVHPGTAHNFEDSMQAVRKECTVPVYGFEVGQYEVLPDFREIEEFTGVTRPDNYTMIRDRVRESGLDQRTWQDWVAATGELSRICYREEVESVLRTPSMSGLSLLGLQDFPGQGTALVGMMDAHLHPKRFPFARPERFRSFFTDQLPLAVMDRYAYTSQEKLSGTVKVANYGRRTLQGDLRLQLQGQGVDLERVFRQVACPVGKLTDFGAFELPLDGVEGNQRCRLSLEIDGVTNVYPVWVYRDSKPERPGGLYEARRFDQQARRVLDQGGTVYLSPDSTAQSLPRSVQAHFSTDFWSVGTFKDQSGTMGQFIQADHPVFADFPTDSHTDWQWWPMATQRAIILPERYQSIITEMDSYAYLRPMTQLLECRCGKGRLLLSSMGLQNLTEYPEAQALQTSIYRYLGSKDFNPRQRIDPEVIDQLVA